MTKLIKEMKQKDRIFIFLCGAGLICQTALEVQIPVELGKAMAAEAGSGLSSALKACSPVLILLAISLVLMVAVHYLAGSAAAGFGRSLREQAFQAAIQKGPHGHEEPPTSAILDLMGTKINLIQDHTTEALTFGLRGILILFFVLFSMLYQLHRMNLLVLVSLELAAAFLFSVIFFICIRKKPAAKARPWDNTSTVMFSVILALSFTAAACVCRYFGVSNEACIGLKLLFTFVGYTVLLMIAAYLLASFTVQLPAAKQSVREISQLLFAPAGSAFGDRVSGTEIGTLEFRHVSFFDPTSDYEAVHDISFQLKRGETLGILDIAGCGSRTVLALAARLCRPTEGSILFDGEAIQEYQTSAFFNKVAYVPEKPAYFSGTIYENVNLGESEAVCSIENTWLALSQARANTYIEQLPAGLHEAFEACGSGIPLAEKQKLSIARALARKPELLLFDNPISAVEPGTAEALRNGLLDDLNGITKVAASPHAASLRHADQLLILKNGIRIVQGVPEVLQ